jgi:hypothetical protein
MIDNDIFSIILKYLIKCHKCDKYYQKIHIDYCDKCHNYNLSTIKIYFCKECSKIHLHDNIDHSFWVRTVFRILIQLYVSIKMKENESKSKQN